MKHRQPIYAPLDFAVKMVESIPCDAGNFVVLTDYFAGLRRKSRNTEEQKLLSYMPTSLYTLHDWLKYKQSYRLTQELADDLFATEGCDIPLDALHVPFPTVYLDFSGIRYDAGGRKLYGAFVTLSDVPYRDNTEVSMCSVVLLWQPLGPETFASADFPYRYGGISFDYFPEHMEYTLEEMIARLTDSLPEGRKPLRDAMLFLAYLSSEQPDVAEDEVQKTIYRSSGKPKATSVRKWDVGVRYMTEKRKRTMPAEEQEKEERSAGAAKRPHVRRAHWHTYRYGPGKKEKKVLWLPPMEIGMKEETPVVVRMKEKKE
ncbi:MAG: hypothetical protein LUE86_10545 [Clostridiales bacterium]|nr:hypothetical protein [Clostridiales bacterium]